MNKYKEALQKIAKLNSNYKLVDAVSIATEALEQSEPRRFSESIIDEAEKYFHDKRMNKQLSELIEYIETKITSCEYSSFKTFAEIELKSYNNILAKAKSLQSEDGWISVEDAPLFIETKDGWECTDAAEDEFWAAIEYTDNRYPDKVFWWIHRCVVEDEIGLCVVGDMDNEPAGWTLKDVTHYMPIKLTPPLPNKP